MSKGDKPFGKGSVNHQVHCPVCILCVVLSSPALVLIKHVNTGEAEQSLVSPYSCISSIEAALHSFSPLLQLLPYSLH